MNGLINAIHFLIPYWDLVPYQVLVLTPTVKERISKEIPTVSSIRDQLVSGMSL